MKKNPCLNLCDILGRNMSQLNTLSYERVYIGSYFCGKYFLHMTTEKIDPVIETLQKKKNGRLALTLVVPMFGQHDLEKGKQRIAELLDRYRDYIDEITVNDYGMLTYIGDTYDYPMNIGRLLNKDYRDMRYEDYYHGTIKPKMFSRYFDQLRKRYRIRGIEFDPTNKGLDLSEAPEHLQIAVHAPFCYITTGQICEFASIDKHMDEKYRANCECACECSQYHVVYLPKEEVVWFRLGRAVYFHNEDIVISGVNEIREIYFPIKELNMLEEKGESSQNERFSACE